MGELFRSALRPLRVLSGADPGVCRAVCETRALSGPQSGEGYPSDLLRALCTVLCREPVFMAPACDWFSVPRTSSPSAGLARGRGGPSSALGGAVDRRRRFLPAKPDSGCGASKRCQAGGGNTMAEEIRLALDDPSRRYRSSCDPRLATGRLRIALAGHRIRLAGPRGEGRLKVPWLKSRLRPVRLPTRAEGRTPALRAVVPALAREGRLRMRLSRKPNA